MPTIFLDFKINICIIIRFWKIFIEINPHIINKEDYLLILHNQKTKFKIYININQFISDLGPKLSNLQLNFKQKQTNSKLIFAFFYANIEQIIFVTFYNS